MLSQNGQRGVVFKRIYSAGAAVWTRTWFHRKAQICLLCVDFCTVPACRVSSTDKDTTAVLFISYSFSLCLLWFPNVTFNCAGCHFPSVFPKSSTSFPPLPTWAGSQRTRVNIPSVFVLCSVRNLLWMMGNLPDDLPERLLLRMQRCIWSTQYSQKYPDATWREIWWSRELWAEDGTRRTLQDGGETRPRVSETHSSHRNYHNSLNHIENPPRPHAPGLKSLLL